MIMNALVNVPIEMEEHGCVLLHNVVWACMGSCVCVTAMKIKIDGLFIYHFFV